MVGRVGRYKSYISARRNLEVEFKLLGMTNAPNLYLMGKQLLVFIGGRFFVITW